MSQVQFVLLTTKITLRLRSGQAPDTKGSDDQNSELRAPFDFAQDMLRVLRGEIIPTINTLAWLMRRNGDSGGGIFATHPATSERIQMLQTLR